MSFNALPDFETLFISPPNTLTKGPRNASTITTTIPAAGSAQGSSTTSTTMSTRADLPLHMPGSGDSYDEDRNDLAHITGVTEVGQMNHVLEGGQMNQHQQQPGPARSTIGSISSSSSSSFVPVVLRTGGSMNAMTAGGQAVADAPSRPASALDMVADVSM